MKFLKLNKIFLSKFLHIILKIHVNSCMALLEIWLTLLGRTSLTDLSYGGSSTIGPMMMDHALVKVAKMLS